MSDDLSGDLAHARPRVGAAERRTCKVLGVARSILFYRSKQQTDDDPHLAPIQLSKQCGRYGDRKVSELLRLEG